MLKFEYLMSNSYFGNVKYKTFILKILDFTFLLDLYKNLGLIDLSVGFLSHEDLYFKVDWILGFVTSVSKSFILCINHWLGITSFPLDQPYFQMFTLHLINYVRQT